VIVGKRLARAVVHLQSSNHALGLRWIVLLGLGRVHLLEFFVQRFLAFFVEAFFEPFAHFVVHVGDVRKAVLEGMEVEGSASDDERVPTAVEDGAYALVGLFCVRACCERFVERPLPDKVVGHALLDLRTGLGRPDRKVFVDLPTVGRDDFSVQFLCDF